MSTLGQNFTQKTPINFECELCDFKCCYKRDYYRHLNTVKHISNAKSTEINTKTPNKPKYWCQKCEKLFSDRSGLWRHKKKCVAIKNTIENNLYSSSEIENKIIEKSEKNNITDKDLIMMLIKENAEFKNMMMEVLKNGTHHTTTTYTNSHNKSFNLQFFLNETCKHAMNITDFVNSIELDLDDLENVSKLGYVDGISNIVINNLKALDITKRPVHCTDKKRDILYIKDNDIWEKENENNAKFRKAIQQISHKNAALLEVFRSKHPDCGKSESKNSDKYNKMIIEAFGGSGTNYSEKEDKIMKNITKVIYIDKINSNQN